MSDARQVSDAKRTAIENLFKDLPDDYDGLALQLEAINRAMREQMAVAFEPKLNILMKAKQLGSHWEHRQFVEAIDERLTNLGLCISFQGTPAVLVSERDMESNDPRSRYAILTPGHRRDFERKAASVEPPDLNLMAAPDNVDVLLQPLRKKANRNFERNWGIR